MASFTAWLAGWTMHLHCVTAITTCIKPHHHDHKICNCGQKEEQCLCLVDWQIIDHWKALTITIEAVNQRWSLSVIFEDSSKWNPQQRCCPLSRSKAKQSEAMSASLSFSIIYRYISTSSFPCFFSPEKLVDRPTDQFRWLLKAKVPNQLLPFFSPPPFKRKWQFT